MLKSLQLSSHYYQLILDYATSVLMVLICKNEQYTLQLSYNIYFIVLDYVPIIQEELYYCMPNTQLQSIRFSLLNLDHDSNGIPEFICNYRLCTLQQSYYYYLLMLGYDTIKQVVQCHFMLISLQLWYHIYLIYFNHDTIMNLV